MERGETYTLATTHGGSLVIDPVQLKVNDRRRGEVLVGPLSGSFPDDETNFRLDIDGERFTEDTVLEPEDAEKEEG